MKRIKGLVGVTFCICMCMSIVSCNKKFTVTGAGGQVYENYQEACNDGDFEAAHKFLDHLYAEYEKTVMNNTDFSYGLITGRKAEERIRGKAVAYCTAANNVYSAELRYLSSSDDSLMWEKCVFFLKELPIVGIKYPSQKEIQSDDGSECFTHCYQNYVTLKNSLCNLLLDLAIEKGKKGIANKTMQCFIENCKITERVPFELEKVYYENDDIDAARKKLEESFPQESPQIGQNQKKRK